MTTLVDCPQSDRAQWSFRIWGTRVDVKFWFWISLAFAGLRDDLINLLIWVAVCFVSILLHEMGHVLAFRFFRRDARVVLYGFGGLAIPNRDVEGASAKVIVSAAGPFAGFLLAGMTLGLVLLTGGRMITGWYLFFPYVSAAVNYKLLLSITSVPFFIHLHVLINDLLFVNFYWGLINLLPVWPLDGGHISRALLEAWDRYDGRRKSLIASAVIGGIVALAGVLNQNMWIVLMFAVFTISNLQALEGESRRAPYRRWR